MRETNASTTWKRTPDGALEGEAMGDLSHGRRAQAHFPEYKTNQNGIPQNAFMYGWAPNQVNKYIGVKCNKSEINKETGKCAQ